MLRLLFWIAVLLHAEVSSATTPDWSMVAYGDSLTADPTSSGFKWCGERIEPPRTCEPRGVSGETAADGVARLLADLDADLIPPFVTYVAMAWGANDLRRGGWDAESQIFEPLEEGAEALIAAGFIPVLWTPNPQFELDPPPFVIEEIVDDRIRDVVAPGIRDLKAELGWPPLADHFADYWFLGEVDMSLLYRDHVHQNADGYAFMAASVQDVVDAHYIALPEPRQISLALPSLLTLAAMCRLRQRGPQGSRKRPLRSQSNDSLRRLTDSACDHPSTRLARPPPAA